MTAWLTPHQVREITGENITTVYLRLERGEIHGHKTGRRWRIHPDVPHAWIRGGDTRQPCCATVTPLRRRSA